MVEATFRKGPLDGQTQGGFAVPDAEDSMLFPIRMRDPADGLHKVFVYDKSPVDWDFQLIEVIPFTDFEAFEGAPLEPAAGSPPGPTAPEPPTPTPDYGIAQAYGKTTSCINSALTAEAIVDAPNDRIIFRLTTPASPNGTCVIHGLGTAKKTANCPTDPQLIFMGPGSKWSNAVIGPPVAALTAERYHPISGFQGRGIRVYSQWIVTTGVDIGWSHGVEFLLY